MVKRITVFFIFLMIPLFLGAQDYTKTTYSLKSEHIEERGRILDRQIVAMNQRLVDMIKKYNYLELTNVRKLPFQHTYEIGDDFVSLERHALDLDPLLDTRVRGIRSSKMIIYTDGTTISRIVYEVASNDFFSGFWDKVTVVDPAPTGESTDDITLSHISNGRIIMEEKKLGDIRNTTASPARNTLKETFLLPNLQTFYDAFLFTAESHYKSFNDSDGNVAEFLKESTAK